MWCRPAGHRRKWWRMVPTWYAQGLLQQEAWNHRAQIKREREKEREKRKIKERDMSYSTSLHAYFLTWARKQEVACITNKHREQEGGRWESPHWLRMWSAQHIWELSENHRPPSHTHTHTDTHVRSSPQALSQYGQDWWEIAAKQWPNPPHPLVSAAVASTLLFSQQLSPQGPTPTTHKHTCFVTRLTLWKMLTVCDLYFSQKWRRTAFAHIRMRIHADHKLWSLVSFIF